MRPVMHGQEVWSYINALEHSPLRAQFAMLDNPESALAVVDAIRIIQVSQIFPRLCSSQLRENSSQYFTRVYPLARLTIHSTH